ncbi:hypothetical protein HPB48_022887 [Haemaphysalis longicornis]|uniref:Uncharacterized protein n=1 Tax=Haemaphysalis longicornis TaxID=44386 RepID=A0A9J6GWM6_HAELO|nr:hypothetical protein HPB48_022887 [Haemaphysalis longicornis]
MAAQDARLRPFTFYARLPKGVTNVELRKIPVQKFSRQELSGQDVRFDYRGSQAKAIRVLHYRNDLPEEALYHALGSFGQVHSCSKESVSGFPGVWSGVRKMRVDINRAVPNLCKRCDRFGHEQCEAPCTKCAGDHAVSQCTFRSFAMVTQQPPPPAGAGAYSPRGTAGVPKTLRAVREDQLEASPAEQSAPAVAAATEDQAEEELVEMTQSVEEAPKSARRKRPRHKRKSHTLAAGASANDGSEDELSRSSRDTPKEKRAAVDGNESSGDERSSISEEMSADSYSSENGDAIENPESTE